MGLKVDYTKFREVCQILNEQMDAKEHEYPNLMSGDFAGIPMYACPDGRTLPPVEK